MPNGVHSPGYTFSVLFYASFPWYISTVSSPHISKRTNYDKIKATEIPFQISVVFSVKSIIPISNTHPKEYPENQFIEAAASTILADILAYRAACEADRSLFALFSLSESSCALDINDGYSARADMSPLAAFLAKEIY